MSDTDSSEGVPLTQAARDIDFESNDIKTIISDMVQYVITASQKKLPIKKTSM